MGQRTVLAFVGTLLLVAACGGTGSGAGPTSAANPTPGSANTAGSGSETTPAPQPTDAAEATSGGGGGGGGGGSLAPDAACKLVTTDEASTATGQPNVTAGPIPLDNMTDALAGCAFVSNGQFSLLNVIYIDTAKTDPNGVGFLPGSEKIAVNGATAWWAPAAGYVVFVYKNDKIVMIQVLMPLNDDIKATASGLVQKVADRM